MARTPDLFATESQPDLFGTEATPAYRPNADKVRARLHKILAEARSAQSLPWEPARLSLYRTIFPQMTLFLPEDEGAQLRFEFETEMARLDSLSCENHLAKILTSETSAPKITTV